MAIVYIITFFLAACSLLYELIIAHSFSFLAGDTVIRYSLTIGLYLGGMGIGALLCKRIFNKSDPWIALYKVELVLSVLGGLAVPVLHYSHSLFCFLRMNERILLGIVVFYACVFVLILGVGLVTGLELPLLFRLGSRRSSRPVANRILGIDYFGSLIAAVSFPLIFQPRMEMFTLGCATALCNTAVAVLIIYAARKEQGVLFRLPAALVIACILILGIIFQQRIQQHLLKRYYYHYEFASLSERFKPGVFFTTGISFPDIERTNSLYQKIDMVRLPSQGNPVTPHLMRAYSDKYKRDPGFPENYLMFLDGDFQFWTDYEEIYHEFFAHVPIILNKTIPRSVLILGAGDGMLARELLKYEGIKSITLVELDKKVVELSRLHPVLSYANKGSLDDPRVKVIIADAYYYLRNTSETFDAVYIDFPDPKNYDLAKLYSVEFYRAVKKHLNPEGFSVLDAPGIDLFSPVEDVTTIKDMEQYPLEVALNAGGALYERDKENCWEIFYQTLAGADFHTIVPYCTNLEAENPEAWRVMEILLRDVEKIYWTTGTVEETRVASYENKNEMIRKNIQAHINNLQMGFIMVKEQPYAVEIEYRDPGISTYTLNKQRFYLAFALPFPVPEVSSSSVNSITRPRLPKDSFWRIKTAL